MHAHTSELAPTAEATKKVQMTQTLIVRSVELALGRPCESESSDSPAIVIQLWALTMSKNFWTRSAFACDGVIDTILILSKWSICLMVCLAKTTRESRSVSCGTMTLMALEVVLTPIRTRRPNGTASSPTR